MGAAGCAGGMRYGDGGGTGPSERVRRERVRQQAARLFDAGMAAVEVACELEVSTKSAYQWRRAWVAGGARALVSKGRVGAGSEVVRRAAGPAG
jgi:transposase-like protein